MDSGYKAVPYKVTKNYGDPSEGIPEYEITETRYRIISTDTGKVLDDAQGYGYKSVQKAYAAYRYKTRDKSKDEERQQKTNHIRKWMQEHKSFVKNMDQFAFEITKGSWGPEDRFEAKFVQEMLESAGLKPDFSASELLRVWRNYR